jgi:membrane complex biogenesis BtpA family protein
MTSVYEKALAECTLYMQEGVDGIIIENFHDKPFYPDNLPPETIAALSAVGREIVNLAKIPVGINALRNDGKAALAIATAIQADFIRVNVHMHTYASDQGLLQGKAYETLRLKSLLRSTVQIYADVDVKHASHIGERDLIQETEDLCQRGLVDAIIVSGQATGKMTSIEDIQTVAKVSTVPLLVGSGVTPENVGEMQPFVSGFIVGSYFKKDGKVENPLDAQRIKKLVNMIKAKP